MTEILLIIFTALLIYFIYRFVKILKVARLDSGKEMDKQNIDLTTKLNNELDTEPEIESESEKIE
jgi:hypothetical protein